MFDVGEVVFHDEIRFRKNVYDVKERRPCIVLFEINLENKDYVCTCPLTSSIKAFNKNPDYYVFIPEIIYSYHTFSFANTNTLLLQELSNTHSTGMVLDCSIPNKIIEKVKESKFNCHDFYKECIKKIEGEEKNKTKNLFIYHK